MRHAILAFSALIAFNFCAAESIDSETDKIVQQCSSRADQQSLVGTPRRSYLVDCIRGTAGVEKKTKPASGSQDKQIKAAQTAVANNLKDPSSAQFREVKYIVRSRAVCGEINAKNSYGAYIGYRAFFVNADGSPYIVQLPHEIRGSNDGETLQLLEAARTKLAEMKDACTP